MKQQKDIHHDTQIITPQQEVKAVKVFIQYLQQKATTVLLDCTGGAEIKVFNKSY